MRVSLVEDRQRPRKPFIMFSPNLCRFLCRRLGVGAYVCVAALSAEEWSLSLWREPVHVRPSARSEHAAALIEESIYIFGGVSARGEILDDLHRYDTRRGEWSGELLGMVRRPAPRRLAVAVGVGPRLYLWGGQTMGGEISGDVQYYDETIAEWSRPLKTSGDLPTPRTAATAAATGELIFVFGGIDRSGNARNDLSVFNTTTAMWSSLHSLSSTPSPRAYAPFAQLYGNFYVYGGRSGNLFLGDLWRIDPTQCLFATASCWTHLTTSLPRANHALVAIEDHHEHIVLLAFGGIDAQSQRLDDHVAILLDAEFKILDVSRQAAPRYPNRLHSSLSTFDGGHRALQFGGEDPTGHATNDFALYSTFRLSNAPSFYIDRTVSEDTDVHSGVFYRAIDTSQREVDAY